MYLLIFEDGEMKTAENVNDDCLQAADAGFLDIVETTDPFNPLRRFNGEWVEIESVED